MPYDDRGFRPTSAPAATPRPGVQAPAPAPAGRVGVRPALAAAPTPAVAPAYAAPVASVPTVAPQVQPPRSAQVTPLAGTRFPMSQGPTPNADAMNAQYDRLGYGPHATEAQVNAARVGVPTAPAARPGVPAPVADWQTRARSAQPGSPEWRQQFWNYNQGTGQHTFDHAAEQSARQGLNLERAGTNQRDIGREAILEQLRYSQEMARAVRGGGTINGSDGAAWGNSVLHHADALARYDATRAGIAQGDAVGQLNQLARMDPAARALYLASKGVDANTIAGLPQPQTPAGSSRFNATNYDQAGAHDPQTAGASAILANEDVPIHEKAATFASIPGIENPNSPHRQLWDAYMARQQARPEFHHELGMYNPLDPNGSKVYDTSTPAASLGSIFGVAKDSVFGVDPAIPARNRKFREDMARLGFGPAQVTGNANDVRARMGIKPADY